MMRTTAAAVVAVAIGLALLLASCAEVAPPVRGSKDRRTALVLVDDGKGGCLAKVANHRANKNDFVTWDVWSFCGIAAKTVEIVFTDGNPLSGTLTSEPQGGGSKWRDIRGKVTGAEGLYPYRIRVNGQEASDPDLEIDP